MEYKFKSNEEISMAEWLREALEHGLISEWSYEERTFPMFEKIEFKLSGKKHVLLEAAEYTPDFGIKFTTKGLGLFVKGFPKAYAFPYSDNYAFIDSKGNFNKHGGYAFSLIQKIMFNKYNFMVEKVVPWYKTKKTKAVRGLFSQTFAPQSLRYKPVQGGLNVVGQSCRSIEEFIAEQ